MRASDMTNEQIIQHFRCMGSANELCHDHKRCQDCPYFVPDAYDVRYKEIALEVADRLEKLMARGGQTS